MRITPAIIALLIVTASVAWSAETMTLAEPGYELAYGESAQLTFTPTGDYQSVHLVYEVRMEFPRAAGSTYVMAWDVNGLPLRAAATRTQVRLLNKPLTFAMASGLEIGWAVGNTWRAVYSPDFELVQGAGAGGMRIEQADPYRFVIDITDMVTRGEENTIDLLHRGEVMTLKNAFAGQDVSLELVFRELSVELSDEPSIVSEVPPAEEFSPDRMMLQPPASVPVGDVASVADGGGITIALPGLTVGVTSRFSRWRGTGHRHCARLPRRAHRALRRGPRGSRGSAYQHHRPRHRPRFRQPHRAGGE